MVLSVSNRHNVQISTQKSAQKMGPLAAEQRYQLPPQPLSFLA